LKSQNTYIIIKNDSLFNKFKPQFGQICNYLNKIVYFYKIKLFRQMKKQLLSIFAALTVSSAIAQTASSSWSISQNAAFTPTSVGIKFMDAVDANVMWVTGYDGFAPRRNYNWYSRTLDGGTTFTAGNIFPDTNTYILANMEGIDANTAWVCSFLKATQGDGAIHRTTNGGATWTNMTATGMFTNTASSFADFVTFLTPSVGITVGDPVNGFFEIWRTTNAGLAWSQIPSVSIPNPLSANEYAIVNLYAKQGTSNIWFGTNQGRIYYTTNTGLTWNVSQVAAPSSTITEIAFNSPLNGVAYAFTSGSTFEMYNTTNGGVTWSQINTISPNVGLNDIVGVPGTNSLVSFGAGTGNNIVSVSTDNGVTWTDYGSVSIQYLTGDFVNGTTGWAGSFSDNTNPAIGGIWKYSGTAGGGTVVPGSAFSMPANLCLTGSSATVIPSNSSTGSPVLTYSWTSTPAGAVFSSPTSSAPVITFSTSNTYTISLIVTNGVGSNTSSQIITVQNCSLPTVNFTVNASACANVGYQTVNTSSGGSPAPSYSWSSIPAGAVNFLPSPFVLSPTISANVPGTYTVILEGINTQGSAQASQVINVSDCSPVAGFNVPSLIYLCRDGGDGNGKFGAVNTTTNPAGISGPISYTWSIAPANNVTYQTGLTLTNFSATVNNSVIAQYTVTLKAKNASGISIVTHTMNVDFCTGISENNRLANNMSISPNPASDFVNITLPASNSAYKLKLVNVLGAVVLEETTGKNSKENFTINLANKARGVYFLTVESATEKVTKKIIVE
jgi:hypothetical protein